MELANEATTRVSACKMLALRGTPGSVKQAFVTGASRGIGAAVALSLSEAGFRIWLHYRAREDAARQVAATIVERGGPEPILVAFDLGRPKGRQ